MRVLEYARSTLTFRIDLDEMPPKTLSHQPPYPMNNARIPIDCRCRVTERSSGRVRTYILGANCKTERVAAASDLWLQPNADFVPIFSDDGFLNLKTFARAGTEMELYPPGSGTQSDRQHGRIAGTFDRVHLDLVEREADHLETPTQIVHAVLANEPLVAVQRIQSDRYVAEIEYPVRTVNGNERDWVYQTDTGPILFPNLQVGTAQLLTSMELAFSAFNAPDWGEFLVRVRTPIAEGVEVYHYSKAIRLDGIENALYRVHVSGVAEHRRVDLPGTIEEAER